MSKFPSLKNGDFDVDDKTGIIELGILSGDMTQKYQYAAALDFRAFYKDLHDTFVENKKVRFVDMLGTKDQQKIGKFLDNQKSLAELEDAGSHLNRTGDMFERKFTWVNMGDAIEFEMEWHAKAPAKHSAYGWYEIKIDLVCRRMLEKEQLINNNKVTLQEGTWEFRNKVTYKNKIVLDYLPKLPIIKNSLLWQQLYLDRIYYKQIIADFEFGIEKILPIITDVIEKHFRPN